VFRWDSATDTRPLLSGPQPQLPVTSVQGIFPACSDDGRYAVFATGEISRVFPDGDHSAEELLLVDCNTGAREQISVAGTGGRGGDAASLYPAIARKARLADGSPRYIAFYSNSTNLTGEDVQGLTLFIRDRQTQSTSPVARSADGRPAATNFVNGLQIPPSISDGTLVLEGDGTGPNAVNLSRTASVGVHTLQIQARDASGNTATAGRDFVVTDTKGKVSVTPAAVAFGVVRGGAPVRPRDVTIKNTGRGKLVVVGITLSNDGEGTYSLAANPGAFVLEPRTSRKVSVQFQPPVAATFNGTLRVTTDDPTRRTVDVKITGRRR
jgi:hypothetical protein